MMIKKLSVREFIVNTNQLQDMPVCLYKGVKKALIILLIILLNPKSLEAQINQLIFDHLTVNQGLSDGNCLIIFQDSRDFLWFGTLNGLNRYDGDEFKIYNSFSNDSYPLRNSYINAITEDHKGRLWIGTNNGLNVFERETEKFYNFMNNNITALHYDHLSDMLWIGTECGLFALHLKNIDITQPTKAIFIKYLNNLANQNEGSSFITKILVNKKNQLWVITNSQFLNCFDRKKNDFEKVVINISPEKLKGKIKEACLDSEDAIWLATSEYNLIKCEPDKNQFTDLILKPKLKTIKFAITHIMFSDNNLWITSQGGGLQIFNTLTHELKTYLHDPLNPFSLSSNYLHYVFQDKSGILWIGSHYSGINKLVWNKTKFGHNYPASEDGLSGDVVSSIIQDRRGYIWIGMVGDGLNQLDLKTNSFTHYKFDPESRNSLNCRRVLSLCEDHNGNIWIGTFAGGLNKLDITTNKFKAYTTKEYQTKGLASNTITSVIEDKTGLLWIGTLENGMALFDHKNGRFYPYQKGLSDTNSLRDNRINTLFIDSKNRLFIGSYGLDIVGLNETNLHTPSPSLTFQHLKIISDKSKVSSISEDSKNNIWICSDEGLTLWDKKGYVVTYNVTDGLPSNNITAVLEDNNFLWVSTKNGLSKFNTITRTFENYDATDGTQSAEFTSAHCKARNGMLFFGGVLGFNAFMPEDIATNKRKPSIVFTGFEVFHKPIRIGQKVNNRIILKKDINELQEIVLSYKENNFSIEFAALDFSNPGKNNYVYLMQGLDNKWISTDHFNEVTFTNLDTKEYIFKVKASNNNGIWNDEGRSIKIIIQPPLWRTSWAYLLYAVLIFAILYIVYRIRLRMERLKNQVRSEQMKSEKKSELDQLKLNFFTSISHDFRTPLSLIIGPLENIINENVTIAQCKEYCSMVYRNAQQLLKLVNQLLDFRKIEEGHLKLETSNGDIIQYIFDIANAFKCEALYRNIKYTIQTSFNYQHAWFDPDKLEKILYNLISNAFKFTPDNGEISVSVSVLKTDRDEYDFTEFVEIKVKDNGIGMPVEIIDKIFNIFYQAEGSKRYKGDGTGIGLSLVKELVKLHNGKIKVESEVGKGSCFTVLLPFQFSNQVLPEEDVTEEVPPNLPSRWITEPVVNKAMEVDVPEKGALLAEGQQEEAELPTVLIVEDNNDIRYYIKNELMPYYTVIESHDGINGFEKAKKIIPTLIISDIMMPGMDGIELCKKLKTDICTSHVPVILLTARNSEKYKIEGYETGADDYITKPFSTKILLVRIRNLIESRLRLREYFNKGINFDPAKISVNSTDEIFIKKIANIITEHFSDTDFDIDVIANELNISRSQLYRKIKALTNQSIQEFIISIRLNKAAEILLSTDLSIAEIAYKVGYTEPSNFTRSFTKFFGQSPKNYLLNYRKKKTTLN